MTSHVHPAEYCKKWSVMIFQLCVTRSLFVKLHKSDPSLGIYSSNLLTHISPSTMQGRWHLMIWNALVIIPPIPPLVCCMVCIQSQTMSNWNIVFIIDMCIKIFMASYRENFPDSSITPKMHLLENHAMDQLTRFGVGFGLINEQGGQLIHTEFNRTGRVVQGNEGWLAATDDNDETSPPVNHTWSSSQSDL